MCLICVCSWFKGWRNVPHVSGVEGWKGPKDICGYRREPHVDCLVLVLLVLVVE